MVPMKAVNWIDVPKPEQAVGEIEAVLGTRAADKDPTKPEWQHHGQQKKGLRFYATAGAPTGEAGFLCWETAGFPGPDQVVVTISNNLTIASYINNIPSSGWFRGEPQAIVQPGGGGPSTIL